jgi:hypothetical protein
MWTHSPCVVTAAGTTRRAAFAAAAPMSTAPAAIAR